MYQYILRRLISMVPTLLLTAVLIFSFVHVIPGDAADVLLGDLATPERLAAVRAELGLDKPLPVQFWIWLTNVLQGDLGRSVFFDRPVAEVIADGAETSILLALLSLTIILAVGIPVGIVSAVRYNTVVDQTASGLAMLAASVPTFWLGLYLILIFSVTLGWLPSSGFPSIFGDGDLTNLRHLILPALTLAAPNSALVIRLVRASMLDVMKADHVRTARAKGVPEFGVITKHMFRNALIGVAATIGFTFAALVSEAVVTETVFSLPGIGRLVVQSILRRDFPVIQGVILVIVLFYLVINLLVDLLYTYLDPRVRLQ